MGLFSKAQPEPKTYVEVRPDADEAPAIAVNESYWGREDPEAAYRKHLLQRFESTRETLERASDNEGRAADLAQEAQIAREGAAEQHREAALSLRRVADGALR